MTNLTSKISLSDDMYSAFAVNKQNDKSQIDPGMSYEVFRNNDTAIEVIVKDTTSRSQKAATNSLMSRGLTIKRLQTDLDKLKSEYDKTSTELEASRNGFKAVTAELKRQLDTVNQRECDIQTKNLALQLENEKLRALLESKTALVDKLKKELLSMKRVMKFAIKGNLIDGICNAPQVPDNLTVSDADYEEFERELRKDCRVRFAGDAPDTLDTLDSSGLKNSRANSFEKQY